MISKKYSILIIVMVSLSEISFLYAATEYELGIQQNTYAIWELKILNEELVETYLESRMYPSYLYFGGGLFELLYSNQGDQIKVFFYRLEETDASWEQYYHEGETLDIGHTEHIYRVYKNPRDLSITFGGRIYYWPVDIKTYLQELANNKSDADYTYSVDGLTLIEEDHTSFQEEDPPAKVVAGFNEQGLHVNMSIVHLNEIIYYYELMEYTRYLTFLDFSPFLVVAVIIIISIILYLQYRKQNMSSKELKC